MTDDPLIVTQEDREAAVAIMTDHWLQWQRDEVLAGLHDRFTSVQTFARHRIAAEATAHQRARIAGAKAGIEAVVGVAMEIANDAGRTMAMVNPNGLAAAAAKGNIAAARAIQSRALALDPAAIAGAGEG